MTNLGRNPALFTGSRMDRGRNIVDTSSAIRLRGMLIYYYSRRSNQQFHQFDEARTRKCRQPRGCRCCLMHADKLVRLLTEAHWCYGTVYMCPVEEAAVRAMTFVSSFERTNSVSTLTWCSPSADGTRQSTQVPQRRNYAAMHDNVLLSVRSKCERCSLAPQ